MIKLILSDLDGTLLYPTLDITRKDKEAIIKGNNQGVEFGVATGRLDYEIQNIEKMIDVHVPYRISQNGGVVCNKDNEVLFEDRFNEEILGELLSLVRRDGVETQYLTKDNYYLEYMSDKTKEKEAKQSIRNMVEDADILNKVSKTHFLTKISIKGNLEDLKEMDQVIREKLGHYVDTYITAVNCIDIVPKGVSKGNSIVWLCGKLGLTLDEVAVIGDSYNDVSMLKVTPNSFVMSHGDLEVQKEGTYIVESVAEAIEKILELNKKGKK